LKRLLTLAMAHVFTRGLVKAKPGRLARGNLTEGPGFRPINRRREPSAQASPKLCACNAGRDALAQSDGAVSTSPAHAWLYMAVQTR
jgi:hypothetical protein